MCASSQMQPQDGWYVSLALKELALHLVALRSGASSPVSPTISSYLQTVLL